MLLILDEPTTGLDVTIQADIMELIVDLNRMEGMSTLLITHDLAVVAESCHDMVVLQAGEVREVGSCDEVLTIRKALTRKVSFPTAGSKASDDDEPGPGPRAQRLSLRKEFHIRGGGAVRDLDRSRRGEF